MRKVEARLDVQIIYGTRETLAHTDTREGQRTSKQRTGHAGKRKTEYKLMTKFIQSEI